MEHLLNTLITHKPLLIIAIIISALILLSVIRRILKMALFLIAIFILYIGYLVFSGQKVPHTKQELIRQGKKDIQRIEQSGKRKFIKP